jgi:bifunctional DNase/RNase
MPVPMHVADVRRTCGEPVRHVVLLERDDGAPGRLPIWMGAIEATALASVLEEAARHEARLPDLLAEALAATDDARTLAGAARALIAANAREIEELRRRA